VAGANVEVVEGEDVAAGPQVPAAYGRDVADRPASTLGKQDGDLREGEQLRASGSRRG
jgi:hypothetical protein